MTKNNKVIGQRWKECERCGLDYPLSQLQKQDGFWLCKGCGVAIAPNLYYSEIHIKECLCPHIKNQYKKDCTKCFEVAFMGGWQNERN